MKATKPDSFRRPRPPFDDLLTQPLILEWFLTTPIYHRDDLSTIEIRTFSVKIYLDQDSHRGAP